MKNGILAWMLDYVDSVPILPSSMADTSDT